MSNNLSDDPLYVIAWVIIGLSGLMFLALLGCALLLLAAMLMGAGSL